MAVDGNWNLTMTTPMGERQATLTLLSSGGTLTGTQGADGNTAEIFDGTISGDAVNWKVSITNPDAVDARVHRQGFRRQHERRDGHRPDGQLPVHGREGLIFSAARAAILRRRGLGRGALARRVRLPRGDLYPLTRIAMTRVSTSPRKRGEVKAS